MPIYTEQDPREVLKKIGSGYALFVAEDGATWLLWPPAYPVDPRSPDMPLKIEVLAELFEILALMQQLSGAGCADLSEFGSKVHSSSWSKGWRDLGFTEFGRYIKFLM